MGTPIGDIEYDGNSLLGYWRRYHYFGEPGENQDILVPADNYHLISANYSKAVVLTEPSYVRIFYHGFYYPKATGDAWRNCVAYVIDSGTGTRVGAFGGTGFYYSAIAAGRITYGSLTCSGEIYKAAGTHTFEIQHRCWQANVAYICKAAQ
jgi:hypothetical protein